MSRARVVARALLARAVRGRGQRGTDWGEAILRELDEVPGGWQSLRWAASGMWAAWRDRLRHLPESRPLGRLPRGWRRTVRIALAGVLAVGALGAINQWVLTVGYQPSSSMAPTLETGDRYLVDRVVFRVTGLHRGDVVLVQFPASDGPSWTGIKRIVGLPGDAISCAAGHLVRNAAVVTEDYLPDGTTTECDPATVPPGEIYLLGDARDVSNDSRHFGAVPMSSVVGRLLATT